ncbi:MAG: ATP-binding protein [Gemmatimonadales bacterium]|nr:ATP-binding protein [Gemmatimonadales bacterium]
MNHSLRLCVRRAAYGEHGGTRVSLELPSDVACIEEAVEVVIRHCLAGVQATAQVRFRLQVALSEAFANAIVCGNREDVSKRVMVQADLGPELFCIRVTDEGEGFDPSLVPDALEPDALARGHGRGLFLIQRMVDDVHFNAQGNSICMTLRRP